jgi:hypothetical protein
MTTLLPAPTLDGQSPGRGDCSLVRGGGTTAPGAADEDPQEAADKPRPIAAMVRNIAALPASRPIDVRNSRRAMLFFLPDVMLSPATLLARFVDSTRERGGNSRASLILRLQ